MKLSLNVALRTSLCAAALMPTVASGQTFPPATIPLHDTDCSYASTPIRLNNPNGTSCTVDGTRTVTIINETVTAIDGTQNRVDGNYHVDFDGTMKLFGAPYRTNIQIPFYGTAQYDFPNIANVDMRLSYDASTIYQYSNYSPQNKIPANDLAWFNRVYNVSSDIRSINV